jgi:ankyrin repeat protein
MGPEKAAIEVKTLWSQSFTQVDGAEWGQIQDNIRKSGEGIIGSGYGYALIHAFVQQGNESAVSLLLQKGADVNARTKSEGCTALHIAVERYNTTIIRLLLNNGADIDAQDKKDRMTALGITIRLAGGNNLEIVRLLKEYGANVNGLIRDANEQTTPLMLALEVGMESMVRLLLELGAAIDTKDGCGNTSLLMAAVHGRRVEAHLLLKRGANQNAKNNRGETALMMAVKGGSEDIVDLLLERGADIEARAKDGETALVIAAKNGREMIVRKLLQKGADVAGYSPGCSPEDVANKQGHHKVSVLLDGIRVERAEKQRHWYQRKPRPKTRSNPFERRAMESPPKPETHSNPVERSAMDSPLQVETRSNPFNSRVMEGVADLLQERKPQGSIPFNSRSRGWTPKC